MKNTHRAETDNIYCKIVIHVSLYTNKQESSNQTNTIQINAIYLYCWIGNAVML